MKYVIGIDEVGRGPLAGPVTLGAVMMEISVYRTFQEQRKFEGLKDSKKLSEKRREEWRKKILDWQKVETLSFSLASSSNEIIDTKGLSFAIKNAVVECLKKFKVDPMTCEVLLDGGLKAPEVFIKQQSIIKGDEKEPIISLASIIAKTDRDRVMKALSEQYPGYGFEVHKGYGTLLHQTALKEKGLTPIHRKSFLRAK